MFIAMLRLISELMFKLVQSRTLFFDTDFFLKSVLKDFKSRRRMNRTRQFQNRVFVLVLLHTSEASKDNITTFLSSLLCTAWYDRHLCSQQKCVSHHSVLTGSLRTQTLRGSHWPCEPGPLVGQGQINPLRGPVGQMSYEPLFTTLLLPLSVHCVYKNDSCVTFHLWVMMQDDNDW